MFGGYVPPVMDLVVIAGLEEIDSISADSIDDSMLLGQAARPQAWTKMLQVLRLADPLGRVSQDAFNEV